MYVAGSVRLVQSYLEDWEVVRWARMAAAPGDVLAMACPGLARKRELHLEEEVQWARKRDSGHRWGDRWERKRDSGWEH